MSTPILTPDVYFDGPAGDTPLDAAGMNRIWAALMQALLDQLVVRQVGADASANMREMLLVDASNGPVTIQAPQAIALGNWGARKIDPSPNKVTILAIGADLLDEHGRTSWTLTSPDDDVIFSFASPGHFVLWRSNRAALPATPTSYGQIKIGGDLAGTADAIRVPGKENVGVAKGLLDAHTVAPDPHGDRAAAQANANQQIIGHAQGNDPHGDRAWGQSQFVPLSWFDGNGQLLPSHTGQLSIINTFPVSSQAAQLALTAQTGDIAIRTDQAKSYILQGSDPSVLSNWTELPSIGRINSVNGQQGTVVLGYSDVGAVSATDPRVTNSEVTTNKNVANGYVGLNASGVIDRARLYAASTTNQGIIQLAGDIGGTAAAPTVPGLALRALTPIVDGAVYSSAKTPAAGAITQYNANTGSFSNVLPAAPTGTSPAIVVEVKNLTPVASTNTVTFTPAGSDTVEGVAGTVVLRSFHEVKRLVGYAGNWTADLGHLSVPSLDARYLQIVNARQVPPGGAAGYALTKNTPTDYDYGWAAVGTATNTQADLKIVSVRSYGAVGDGTTDDTAKIQQAIANTPAGGVCYLPPGQYGITAPIVIPPNVTLEGAHTDTLYYTQTAAPNNYSPTPSCSLKVLPAFAGVAAVRMLGKTAGGYTTSSVGQRMRRIFIDMMSAPNGIKGVQVFGFVREITLEDVTVRRATDNGFAFDVDTNATAEQSTAPQSNRLYRCVADNCTGAGFSISNMPDSTFVDCNAQGNGWHNFYIAGMMNSTLIGCRAEWSKTGNGFWIGSGYWGNGPGSGGFTMNGCMTDRNQLDGIFVSATGASSILINSQIARRDGRNSGNGGGNYAAVQVNGATMPVMVESIIVYPGQDDADNGAITASPQFGVRAINATHVAVAGASYLHAVQAPFSDAGGNGTFYRANALGTATGPTTAPVRQPPAAATGAPENTNVVAASGTALTLPDITTATIHDVTLTGNCALTFPAAANGKSFTLILRQDATGGRTITWPGGILWPSGTIPTRTTTAGSVDIMTFIAVGTAWSGAMGVKDVR